MTDKTHDLSTSLSNLKISPTATPKALQPRHKKPATAVAESWEDEAGSSSEPEDDDEGSDTETESLAPSLVGDGMNPPPPTPTTPRSHTRGSSSVSSARALSPRSPPNEAAGREGRPATTDAVARRMILAGIGVRQKSSKEQREYDAAVREKEKKRITEERQKAREVEAQQEAAKSAVWGD